MQLLTTMHTCLPKRHARPSLLVDTSTRSGERVPIKLQTVPLSVAKLGMVPSQKLARAIYRDFLSCKKNIKFSVENL